MSGVDDCPEEMVNLKKARNSLVQLTRILGREGASLRVSGIFFKEVVQAVLLFGSDTWIMTPCMEWDLRGFQHRVTQQSTERQPMRHEEGGGIIH